jgi:hypothetical protein
MIQEESQMEYKATCDSNDNLTLVETTVLQDGKRVPHDRYVLKYSNNNPVSIEVYGDNGNDVGEMYYKANNTYDAGGNRTLSESYAWRWDSSLGKSKWTELDRYVNTYDANGKRTLDEFYRWNTSSGSWIGSSKYVYAHDENGNRTLSEYYSWNISSGSWIGNDKEVYAYDANGNRTLYEYYRWDTSSGGWIGSSKTVYERNEYGETMLYKSYLWNSGWGYTSYTIVYYPESGYPDGTARIGETGPLAYVYGDALHIRTVHAERIEIYTLTGSKVYEGSVPAGTSVLSAGRLPKGVLIVKGSSGWTGKVVR